VQLVRGKKQGAKGGYLSIKNSEKSVDKKVQPLQTDGRGLLNFSG
jgi:hypothetical protein